MLILIALAALTIGLATYVVREAILSRRDGNRPVNQGDGHSIAHTLVGLHAYCETAIDHVGVVAIDGETWTAQSKDQSAIPKGTWVTIVRAQGIKVIVEPIGADQYHDKDDQTTDHQNTERRTTRTKNNRRRT